MIEVKNLVKTYGKKDSAFNAVDGVSFTIPTGKSIAILGKSGSGKSTLMHIMSGLDKPTSGEIIIDGQNILKLKQKDIDKFRSSEMSFIFQSFFVQAKESCYDNVSLPLEIAKISVGKRRKMIESALAAVDMSEKVKAKAKELSGGQKQRLAVARAIVNSPTIVFADEPTGNLDSVTGGMVEDLLFKYSKENDVTLIIVTHDSDLANRCEMQIHLKDGQIDDMNPPKFLGKTLVGRRLKK
ncbi:MAG: ABC transporter ATP-binding protein [Candidatus Saccharibacteria bacterium]